MVKNYLCAYNAVAFIFWSAFLCYFLFSRLQLNSTSLLLLNIAQGLAILEILHVAVKWVKSPFVSTVAQVASRILVLVLINLFWTKPEYVALLTPGVIIVAFAWSITEMVRYSFYFLVLLGKNVYPLLWMRYSFFIILYPLGVFGEALIMLAPVYAEGFSFNSYTLFIGVVFASYLFYFPVLYGYMWKQRKAKL